jgi:hypothetical protein
MTLFRTLAALAAFVISGTTFADTDCTDPIATWKPREVLQKEFEQYGRTAQRIRVDDGCYEIRGVDRMGNKIKAKYFPASLRIRSLEVEFGTAGDASDYLGPVQPVTGRSERTDPTTKRSSP